MSALPEERLWELEDRYRGSFDVEPLSYGTVRDFADSTDHLGGLARASSDMKDLQRCWVVKALLGRVERGERLVEIGAGEPLVADLLTRLGHRVTVVDPYDGSGHGPEQFDEFRRAYPDVDFVRERFPPSGGLPDDVAAVYSISVLEHIPLDEVGGVVEAASGTLRPGGCCIHAIDHVVAGWGAEPHLERLEEIVRRSGLAPLGLHELIGRLEADPDTYFVSAEAHERWRGALPYDDHPMRRIASIGVLSRA
ncbi:MAG: methyltransferase domain-containing protein [Solirubrobacterales bacterium]